MSLSNPPPAVVHTVAAMRLLVLVCVCVCGWVGGCGCVCVCVCVCVNPMHSKTTKHGSSVHDRMQMAVYHCVSCLYFFLRHGLWRYSRLMQEPSAFIASDFFPSCAVRLSATHYTLPQGWSFSSALSIHEQTATRPLSLSSRTTFVVCSLTRQLHADIRCFALIVRFARTPVCLCVSLLRLKYTASGDPHLAMSNEHHVQ